MRSVKEIKGLYSHLSKSVRQDFTVSIRAFNTYDVPHDTEDNILDFIYQDGGSPFDVYNDLAVLWYYGFRTTEQIIKEYDGVDWE